MKGGKEKKKQDQDHNFPILSLGKAFLPSFVCLTEGW